MGYKMLSFGLNAKMLLAVVAVSIGAGCKSTGGTADSGRLPFHVALVPIGDQIYEDRTPEGSTDESNLVRLTSYADEGTGPASMDFVAILEQELEERVFSEVTVLGGSAESRGAGLLVEEAKNRGADLLMTLEQVDYDADPETKARHLNWFWYLTGPAVYFFHDRDYRLDCTVEVALYDIHRIPLRSDGDHVLDDSALVRRFRAKSDWIATRFPDRAEGAFDWVKSLVVPTNLLRRHGTQARRKIASGSLHSMAASLAEDISIDSEFVTRPSSRGTLFYLAQDESAQQEPRLVALGEGAGPTHLLIQTSVLQRARGGASEFGVAEVRCGDAVFDLLQASDGSPRRPDVTGSISIEVGEGSMPSGWVRKRVEVRVPVEALMDLAARDSVSIDPTIQVVLQDSRGDTQTRSWTFPIPASSRQRVIGVLDARFQSGEDVHAEAEPYRPNSNQ